MRRRPAVGAFPAAAAACGLVTLVALPEPDPTLAGAVGLIVAGAVAAVVRPGTGAVTTSLAGLALLGVPWAAWESAPPLARSIGTAAAPFVLPLVVHVAVGPTRHRAVIAVPYALAALYALGLGLFRDPLLDLACVQACGENMFLLSPQPRLVRVLDAAWGVVGIAAAALLVLSARSLPARHLVMGLPAAAVVLPLPVQWRALAALALAAGVVATAARAWQARRAVARLASDLADTPGSLADTLARATGDATLQVVYPVPSGYVDAAGRRVEPPAGRARTPLVRDGREVALVLHDPATVQAAQLRDELGAAAQLAVENERLAAELLAQLADVATSRLRVVEAADAERRRLERNLHDGAQQGLLALALDLRSARSSAARHGDETLAPLLAAAEVDAAAALDELRRIAQGIYPGALTDAGIGPALWVLAEEAAVPVELGELPGRRFPPALERTVFALVAGALDGAGADGVDVAVHDRGVELVVEIDGAGPPATAVRDRVGAVGGRLEQAGDRLRAVLPCG